MHRRVAEVEGIVGHHFENRRLIESAITHPSAAEGHSASVSYERLEFLGDSLLGAIVAAHLYESFPDMDEGELTHLKISLVSGEMLSEVASELGLAPLIVLGESERGTGARGMHSALEDVFEALVGALYLDAGIDVARQFVFETIIPRATRELAVQTVNPKSRLQEVTQRDMHCAPDYKLVSEDGPAHNPTFTTVAFVGGARVGRGSGRTKKASENAAAADALANLGYQLVDAPRVQPEPEPMTQLDVSGT